MKKLNVRKIGILVLCCIGVVGLLITLSFATRRQKATRSENLSINIDNNTEEEAFISEDDIKAFFKDRRDSILKAEIKNIQVNDLEKALNTHPAVENAEVSVDVNGDVEVDVRQRHPHCKGVQSGWRKLLHRSGSPPDATEQQLHSKGISGQW